MKKQNIIIILMLMAFWLLCLSCQAQSEFKQRTKQRAETIRNELISQTGNNQKLYAEDTIGLSVKITRLPIVKCNRRYVDLEKMEYVTPITVEDLIEYKEVCYNDSTQQKFNLYKIRGKILKSAASKYDIDLGHDPSYIRTETQWVHKTPTFEDFLNWLEKKTK